MMGDSRTFRISKNCAHVILSYPPGPRPCLQHRQSLRSVKMAASSPPAKKACNHETGSGEEEDPAVSLFREYVRIPSVSRGEDYLKHYVEAVKFIQKVAESIGLSHELIEVAPGNNVVLITVEGTNPELKSVLLNSHYDVVPVFPEYWKYDAFAAHKEENGDIYGRGTQDMKCCTIWQLEALRKIKASGKKFRRNLYLSVVPDEELGGGLGMVPFCESERFKKMNVGFSLDEGLANPTEAVSVYYGERSPYWVEVTCKGNPGHGSRFIENTAVEKVEKLLKQALAYREQQKSKMDSKPCLKLGDVTSVNVTEIHGGVAANVVPDKFVITLDLRFSPYDDHEELLKMVRGWLDEAGEDCTLKFVQRSPKYPMTSTEDSDPWWKAFSTACAKHSLQLEKEVFPAGTDSRFLRAMGIPCLGFTPLNHTPILLHDHNEWVNERVFLRGTDIFVDIISALCEAEST